MRKKLVYSFLLFIFLSSVYTWSRWRQGKSTLIVKKVAAEEVMPWFDCPCCDKDIASCDCPLAQQRRQYLKEIAAGQKQPLNDLLFPYIRKYGLASLRNPEQREKIKQELRRRAPAERPELVLSPPQIDLGLVSVAEGEVSRDFQLQNRGQKPLRIEGLTTSCGCTTATIIWQGEEGPRFGMPGHGLNAKNKGWSVEIPPQGKAILRVYYNPRVHPRFRGDAVRTITVISNDPIEGQKEVQILLQQVD